jgi:hypothetical protein
MGRRIRCRVGRHKWRRRHTEDNESYIGCEYCDAVQLGPPSSRGGIPPGAIPSA